MSTSCVRLYATTCMRSCNNNFPKQINFKLNMFMRTKIQSPTAPPYLSTLSADSKRYTCINAHSNFSIKKIDIPEIISEKNH